MPTDYPIKPALRCPSLASRRRTAWLSIPLVASLGLWLMAGVSYAGNGLPWFYFLGNLKIGPFPSQRLCKDDLGSCHYEHGSGCLSRGGKACAPTGPGFGVINGVDMCSADCTSDGYHKGFYYVVVAPDGALSLSGPYSKRACINLSDECLSIGAIPNTEGSRGGP